MFDVFVSFRELDENIHQLSDRQNSTELLFHIKQSMK